MAALGRTIPAQISGEDTQKVQSLTREIFQALDCKGVVRVDFMLDQADGALYITEINTIPGSLLSTCGRRPAEGLSTAT